MPNSHLLFEALLDSKHLNLGPQHKSETSALVGTGASIIDSTCADEHPFNVQPIS